MEWKEQFEIFEKIISQLLLAQGEKFSQGRAAEFLGIPAHKYRAWKDGQRPVVEDLRMLAQEFEFNPDWLLLGIGKPRQRRLDDSFNPKNVEICDTLHDLVAQLPDRLPTIAAVGGISTTDLYDCIHTQKLPPTEAVSRWVRHYRVNANFLLAQIGKPFLSEDEFLESGPLDRVREGRGDFWELDSEGMDGNEALEKAKDEIFELRGKLNDALEKVVRLQEELLVERESGRRPSASPPTSEAKGDEPSAKVDKTVGPRKAARGQSMG